MLNSRLPDPALDQTDETKHLSEICMDMFRLQESYDFRDPSSTTTKRAKAQGRGVDLPRDVEDDYDQPQTVDQQSYEEEGVQYVAG